MTVVVEVEGSATESSSTARIVVTVVELEVTVMTSPSQ
jgi:hypothetical protein